MTTKMETHNFQKDEFNNEDGEFNNRKDIFIEDKKFEKNYYEKLILELYLY
jgi:hypothetical protein